jgi:transaldolase
MKDPKSPDTLYISAFAAPNTINTMPDATLRAFADHGEAGALARDGGDCEQVIAAHQRNGIDVEALATKLQVDGAKAFVDSWQDLLGAIEKK